jgi:hypothetical protein
VFSVSTFGITSVILNLFFISAAAKGRNLEGTKQTKNRTQGKVVRMQNNIGTINTEAYKIEFQPNFQESERKLILILTVSFLYRYKPNGNGKKYVGLHGAVLCMLCTLAF